MGKMIHILNEKDRGEIIFTSVLRMAHNESDDT